MAKKFGKFLLFSAAVGAVAGSAYYYFQHKDSVRKDIPLDTDDDYDDFSEDLDEECDRNYVDLDLDKADKTPVSDLKTELSQKASGVAEKVLEKTADALSAAAGKLSETAHAIDNAMNTQETSTEEFFDDEDAPAADEAAEDTTAE